MPFVHVATGMPLDEEALGQSDLLSAFEAIATESRRA